MKGFETKDYWKTPSQFHSFTFSRDNILTIVPAHDFSFNGCDHKMRDQWKYRIQKAQCSPVNDMLVWNTWHFHPCITFLKMESYNTLKEFYWIEALETDPNSIQFNQKQKCWNATNQLSRGLSGECTSPINFILSDYLLP